MSESGDARNRVLLNDRVFLTLSVVLGAFQAWVGRQSMGPDGVSYLDIGDAYLRGDWKAAINAYWSPMYSIVLGTAMRILKPSLRWEFPVVHLVNFVIYLAALFSFRLFLRSAMTWSRHNDDADPVVPLPEPVVVGMGYIIFLWSSLVLVDVVLVNPDLLVAALLFLLGALLVELRVQYSIWKFMAFGVVCGVAYLTKGIMFPLGFIFLAVLLFSGTWSKARWGGVLLAGVVLLIVSSPFIFALSKAKGRLTYGDTGKLAYAEMVSPRAPGTNWQGDPAGSGIPLHPTRKILDGPPVFEYAGPVGGTYPPWYDPSYWNDGMRSTFRLRPQLRVLVESALTYGKVLQGYAAFIAGIAIFVLIGKKPVLKAVAQNWPLWIISLAAAGVYALVLVRNRYIAGFAALFFVAILTGIRLPKNDKFERIPAYVAMGVILATLVSLASSLANGTYLELTVGPGPLLSEQADVAEGLHRMGLRANDKVAVLGEGLTGYWARLARFKIVAEIASSNLTAPAFWAATPELKARAYEAVGRTKARAIIAWSPPESGLTQSWRQIAGTHYYVYVLPN